MYKRNQFDSYLFASRHMSDSVYLSLAGCFLLMPVMNSIIGSVTPRLKTILQHIRHIGKKQNKDVDLSSI